MSFLPAEWSKNAYSQTSPAARPAKKISLVDAEPVFDDADFEFSKPFVEISQLTSYARARRHMADTRKSVHLVKAVSQRRIVARHIEW